MPLFVHLFDMHFERVSAANLMSQWNNCWRCCRSHCRSCVTKFGSGKTPIQHSLFISEYCRLFRAPLTHIQTNFVIAVDVHRLRRMAVFQMNNRIFLFASPENWPISFPFLVCRHLFHILLKPIGRCIYPTPPSTAENLTGLTIIITYSGPMQF